MNVFVSHVFCLAANAQHVKTNEALQTGKKVETPPVPSSVSKVCKNAKCHAGAWHLVETNSGLMECTDPWGRSGSCRTSTFGSQKLARVWVVKRNSEWTQRQYPDLTSECTPVFA